MSRRSPRVQRARSCWGWEGLEIRALLAPVAYAVTDASRLYTVDVATGAAQFVASTSEQLTDIAFDSKGTLYGVDLGGELYSVDLHTGQASAIGWAGASLNALAFAPDGTLFGAGKTGLFAINPATGAGTQVADLTAYPSAGDLTFDGAGDLILSSSGSSGMLIRIDPSTGTVTPIGSLGASDVYGLSYGPDGVVYGATSGSRQILAVNPDTGATTVLASYNGDGITKINGTAFVDESRRPGILVADAEASTPTTGMGELDFSVTLAYAVGRPVSFSYSTSDGSATSPADYAATSGTITFAPGEVSKTIAIPLVGKILPGPSKTLRLNLSHAVNGSLAATSATGTIDDPGGGPTVSLSASGGSFDENGGIATVTATLSAASGSPTTVNLGFSGSAAINANFTAPTSIVIPAGKTSASISLTGMDDNAITGPLAAKVAIASATGATPVGPTSVSLTELDTTALPSVAINAVTGKDSAGSFQFVVSLSRPLATPVSVSYSSQDGTAVHGLDFSAVSGTIAFAAGQTTQAITVPILNDPAYKPDKTFTIALTNPVRASLAGQPGQGTILNTAGPPRLTIEDLSILEGGRGTNSGSVVLRLSARSELPVSVTLKTRDLTAKAGRDYDALQTSVTFLPGETERSVSVAILGNLKKQGNRTFELDVASVTGASTSGGGQATVTIVDDDVRNKLQKNSLGTKKPRPRPASAKPIQIKNRAGHHRA